MALFITHSLFNFPVSTVFMASASPPAIPVSCLDFLQNLKEHNNRDWFNLHKDHYLEQLAHIETFADRLLQLLNTHDEIETPSGKNALHRIYRDTRFSKDKTPYKTWWSGGYKRATRLRRGGCYFHIEPGNSFVAGGFFGPNAEDLRRIREEINFDPEALKKILEAPSFKATFGELQGEQLKTVPKGFDIHPDAAGLLRYKQFILRKNFNDLEVTARGFVEKADQSFRQMRPFFDYMSMILASDANGLPLA